MNMGMFPGATLDIQRQVRHSLPAHQLVDLSGRHDGCLVEEQRPFPVSYHSDTAWRQRIIASETQIVCSGCKRPVFGLDGWARDHYYCKFKQGFGLPIGVDVSQPAQALEWLLSRHAVQIETTWFRYYRGGCDICEEQSPFQTRGAANLWARNHSH